MEEARQHPALRTLKGLSLILWVCSAAGLLALVLTKNVPILGYLIVPTMLLALLSRAGAYAASFAIWRGANQAKSIWMAIYAAVWLLLSIVFFIFVVLRQFEVTP